MLCEIANINIAPNYKYKHYAIIVATQFREIYISRNYNIDIPKRAWSLYYVYISYQPSQFYFILRVDGMRRVASRIVTAQCAARLSFRAYVKTNIAWLPIIFD